MKRFFLYIAAFLLLALLSGTGCRKDDITVRDEPLENLPAPDGTTPQQDPDDADAVDWAAAVSYVFDESVIPEIHISLTQAEWKQLLAYYDANPNTQEYVQCDVRYVKGTETTEIPQAGLRLKGNTSRRRPEEGGKRRHVHFGLDFHHNVKDPAHTLHGIRKVDLKWFKDDAAYVREIYSYDLFRRFGVWTAIRDVYARLWVKVGDAPETYYGVYGLMEHIDKNYVRVRRSQFGHKGGNLWKCRYGADMRTIHADIGVDDNQNDHHYELKTNKDSLAQARAQLQDFIRQLNELEGSAFDKWIASVMDVPLFLRTLAVNVAVGMWDDAWNNTNNFYLYFDNRKTSGYHVWWIPYDYDNTLGTSLNCGVQSDAGRQDPYRWGPDQHPLFAKILRNPLWRSDYRRLLQELCGPGGLSAYENAAPRIRAWQGRIAPFVSNDTGEDMTVEDRPAPWGNHHEYRILAPGASNWFTVKSAAVSAME